MSLTADQLVIFAARAGNLTLLEQRVSAGGNLNYVDPMHGTALIEAITRRHLPVVEWLLTHGADVNVQISSGTGPLEIALRDSDPEVVYRLVCAGAKLTRKARPHYKKRLEECLKKISDKKSNSQRIF